MTTEHLIYTLFVEERPDRHTHYVATRLDDSRSLSSDSLPHLLGLLSDYDQQEDFKLVSVTVPVSAPNRPSQGAIVLCRQQEIS